MMFNKQKDYTTIAFDVFGTLAKIQQGRSPYRKMIKYLNSCGRDYRPDDAITIMSFSFTFEQLANYWGWSLPDNILQELHHDLLTDLQDLTLYTDTLLTLNKLKNAGFKLALCSNLASPYGQKICSMLPDLDAYALSYEVGAIKPEPKIYQAILDQIGCGAYEVLFIGDTPLADLTGPQSFGMSARLIDRKNGQNLQDILADLL